MVDGLVDRAEVDAEEEAALERFAACCASFLAIRALRSDFAVAPGS